MNASVNRWDLILPPEAQLDEPEGHVSEVAEGLHLRTHRRPQPTVLPLVTREHADVQ
jgi:hypothetical protein